MTDRLKYQTVDIVFQEVPGEVSIAFGVSGCPYRCEGCHSPNLQKNEGRDLEGDLADLLLAYDGMITCVCFMGGDHNLKQLKELLEISKGYSLKTCLYTGRDNAEEIEEILPLLDYVKIGHYDKSLGG